MDRIQDFSTPKTLRVFTTSKGEEYVLKGSDKPESYPDYGGYSSYEHKHLKLYKKVQEDGLDTFKLVAKKDEKLDSDGKITKIVKELFDVKSGKMTEQAEIAQNVGFGKTIECHGDVFNMTGNIATNFNAKNTPNIDMNLSKGKLTPMAKRILKVLMK